MAYQSLLGGSESHIVAIPGRAKVPDPVFLNAHRTVGHVSRQRLIDALPVPRRGVQANLVVACLSKPVGKKNLSSAAWMEPPTAGPFAVSGPG